MTRPTTIREMVEWARDEREKNDAQADEVILSINNLVRQNKKLSIFERAAIDTGARKPFSERDAKLAHFLEILNEITEME